MKRSRFSAEQIIGILKEGQAGTVRATCAKHNVSEQSYYGWKRKYGGMEVDEARRTRRLGTAMAQRQRAKQANYVWSWDIIHDQLGNGRALRILTLIDEFTKQSLAIEPRRSIRAIDAIAVIEEAIEQYGLPQHIRSDNGSEFVAGAIRDWMSTKEIRTLYF